MFHTLANYISIGQTVDTDVTPVTDNVILIQNSHWVFQQDMNLFAAAAMETTPSRVRIVTPSLRIPSTPWIRPLITGASPGNLPVIADYRAHPLTLKALEETQIWATSALGSGNEAFYSLLWVGDSIQSIPAGNIVTMRGTSTTAAVSHAWTTLTVTWQDTLPFGTYAIVGFNHESANGVCARLNINGQPWRPGTLSLNALGNYGPQQFLKGGMGVWGTFRSTAMPIVEVLVNGTDASHELYLEFVRTS